MGSKLESLVLGSRALSQSPGRSHRGDRTAHDPNSETRARPQVQGCLRAIPRAGNQLKLGVCTPERGPRDWGPSRVAHDVAKRVLVTEERGWGLGVANGLQMARHRPLKASRRVSHGADQPTCTSFAMKGACHPLGTDRQGVRPRFGPSLASMGQIGPSQVPKGQLGPIGAVESPPAGPYRESEVQALWGFRWSCGVGAPTTQCWVPPKASASRY